MCLVYSDGLGNGKRILMDWWCVTVTWHKKLSFFLAQDSFRWKQNYVNCLFMWYFFFVSNEWILICPFGIWNSCSCPLSFCVNMCFKQRELFKLSALIWWICINFFCYCSLTNNRNNSNTQEFLLCVTLYIVGEHYTWNRNVRSNIL